MFVNSQKVSRRKKALKASTTLPEQEKTRYMGALKAAYMSSDESMSDEDDSEDDDQLKKKERETPGDESS